jgi:glutathione S-transferase
MIYLAEKYAKDHTLYPKDVQARAIVNQRLFFDVELYSKFGQYHYPVLFHNKPINPENYGPMVTTMEYFDKFLENQKFAAGNDLTLADLSLVATIATYDVFGFDLTKFKNVWRWYQECQKIIPGYEVNKSGAQAFGKMFEHVKLY